MRADRELVIQWLLLFSETAPTSFITSAIPFSLAEDSEGSPAVTSFPSHSCDTCRRASPCFFELPCRGARLRSPWLVDHRRQRQAPGRPLETRSIATRRRAHFAPEVLSSRRHWRGRGVGRRVWGLGSPRF